MSDIQNTAMQNAAMQNMAMQNTAMQNTAAQNVQQDITKEKSDTIHNENTQHKDSLFVDLFYSDETARENLLSLYNALHGTSLTDPELVHKLKIDDVLYKNFKNDISFVMGGQVFVFGEHQSTVNPNMPLRCLMYAGRGYEQLVSKEARYKTRLAVIPTPEFFVFYNGRQDAPPESELRLSDAYQVSAPANTLELTVRVININTAKGHELLKKCRVLREYSLFVDTVRRYQDADCPEPVKEAVRECIKEGILAEYLSRKGSEVVSMLIAEYDYETDIRVKREEAWEEGREAGIAEGREEGKAEGKAEGRTEGKAEGKIEGKAEGVVWAVRRMCLNEFTTAQIAAVLDEAPEFVERIVWNSKAHPDWTDEEILNASREG